MLVTATPSISRRRLRPKLTALRDQVTIRNSTNLQYTQALQQSLRAAGLSEAQVQQAVRAAIRERVQRGLLGGMEVPRVPGPIRNLAECN